MSWKLALVDVWMRGMIHGSLIKEEWNAVSTRRASCHCIVYFPNKKKRTDRQTRMAAETLFSPEAKTICRAYHHSLAYMKLSKDPGRPKAVHLFMFMFYWCEGKGCFAPGKSTNHLSDWLPASEELSVPLILSFAPRFSSLLLLIYSPCSSCLWLLLGAGFFVFCRPWTRREEIIAY